MLNKLDHWKPNILVENTGKHTIEVYGENGGWIEANIVDVYAHELMVTYKNGFKLREILEST